MTLSVLGEWWSLTPTWEWHFSVTEVLLVAVVLLSSYWITCRVRHFSLWRRHGIPGPSPSLLFGNLLQIRAKNKDILAVQTEWLDKYGNVCGYFTGYRPTLLVADLKMLRHILIKDFPSFANRARYFLAKKPYSDMIVDQRDHRWKFQRRITNPVFSLAKLKKIVGLMQQNVDDFLSVVSEHADKSQDFDIFSVSQRLSLDVIGRCVLAMKLDCLMNPQESLIVLVRRFFQFAISPLVVVAMMLPGLAPCLRFFRASTDAALVEKAITKNLREVLAYRRANPHQGSSDFLQLFINASDDTGVEDNSTLEMTDEIPPTKASSISSFPSKIVLQPQYSPLSSSTNSSSLPSHKSPSEAFDILSSDPKSTMTTFNVNSEAESPVSVEEVVFTDDKCEEIFQTNAKTDHIPACNDNRGKYTNTNSQRRDSEGSGRKTRSNCTEERLKLTDDEIVGNAYMFVLAGYETTATAIAFTCYCLARHKDWQDKCFEEIQNVMEKKTHLTYEDVGCLSILDRVFQETLRLYPPVPSFITREAGVSCEVEGITIPQGANIIVPVWHIHHNPNLWSQPYLFDPDRFLPERRKEHHPLAYLPFGAGPRNCLGLRFARLEIKMVIASLLRDYILELAPSVKDPLPVGVQLVTLSPTEGVWLKIKRRTE